MDHFPGEHRGIFVVVGGAVLLFHWYPVFTNDTDLAVTADLLHKFETLAMPDPHPPKNPFGESSFESHSAFADGPADNRPAYSPARPGPSETDLGL